MAKKVILVDDSKTILATAQMAVEELAASGVVGIVVEGTEVSSSPKTLEPDAAPLPGDSAQGFPAWHRIALPLQCTGAQHHP